MAGTRRTIQKQVRFFELYSSDGAGNSVPISPDFWPRLRASLFNLKPNDRSSNFRTQRFVGTPVRAVAPAVEYIQFGHVQDRAGYDRTYDEETGHFGYLTVTDETGKMLVLAAATYLVDVPGTNYIAVLSEGRAANLAALDHWLATITNSIDTPNTLALMPVVDAKTRDKLAAAVEVSKIEIQIPKGVSPDSLAGSGDVGAALVEASRTTRGEAAVFVSWSFGRDLPSATVGGRMLGGLRRVLGGAVPLDKATAKLVLPGRDGKEKREEINFLTQRIAFGIRMDVLADDVITEEVALRGIQKAIGQFRTEVME